jgi:hypothetical protein
VHKVSSRQSIAELAYHLWNARGRPRGSVEEDWVEAERQLATAQEADRDGGKREDAWNAAGKRPRSGTVK